MRTIHPSLFVTFLFLSGGSLSAADADLILHNGRIVTVDGAFSVREAVAVKAGRITAVGSDAEVLRERGTATRVIHLKGKNCRCSTASRGQEHWSWDRR